MSKKERKPIILIIIQVTSQFERIIILLIFKQIKKNGIIKYQM